MWESEDEFNVLFPWPFEEHIFSLQKGGPVTAPGLQKSYCPKALLFSSMIYSDMFCQSNLPFELHRTFKTLVNNSEMNGFLV